MEGTTPKKGDSVEMWCQGLHVPGAWLEAVVHNVEHGRLYLGEVGGSTVGCRENLFMYHRPDRPGLPPYISRFGLGFDY